MRPRVFPAEDRGGRGAGGAELDRASMRPRVFPAEDPGRPGLSQSRRRASMRPRVFPAEDVTRTDWSAQRARGFNEAAGIPRGRLTGGPGEDARAMLLQ